MDSRKLQTLLAVAAAGSLNAASEELNCTQSAVTQMMNAIEDELGFAVFKRTNRGVKLTEEGEAIMPYVTAAEQSLQELKDEAEKIVEGKRVPLRVGTFSSLSASLLPDLMNAFWKIHPEITFEIKVGSDELPGWLDSREIHVLFADEARKSGKEWYPVLEDMIYAVVPAEYGLGDAQALTENMLMQYPVIINSLDRSSAETAPIANAPRAIRISTDDDFSQLRMASRGMGIAFLPELSLRMQALPDNIDLLELDPPVTRVIGVGLPPRPLRAAREFAAFLRKHAREYYKNQK